MLYFVQGTTNIIAGFLGLNPRTMAPQPRNAISTKSSQYGVFEPHGLLSEYFQICTNNFNESSVSIYYETAGNSFLTTMKDPDETTINTAPLHPNSSYASPSSSHWFAPPRGNQNRRPIICPNGANDVPFRGTGILSYEPSDMITSSAIADVGHVETVRTDKVTYW